MVVDSTAVWIVLEFQVSGKITRTITVAIVCLAISWLVKKAWMLTHPAHLTSITQNCTSFLNSPLITVELLTDIQKILKQDARI